MAERLFSDLVTRISPSAPGCPQPVILTYIRNTAIEVCEKTLAYKYVQPDIILTPDVYSNAYAPPATTEVHAIITAHINGTKLPAKPIEELATIFPRWPTTTTIYSSQPQFVAHFDPDTFYTAPTPDAATSYVVRMVLALKPLRDATGLEKAVLDGLEDAIVDGTLQKLLVLPEKPWSDREAAAYHAKQFIFKVAERRARANLGAGRATLAIRTTPWA